MGIEKVTELPRVFENELAGRPRAVRSWAITLSSDTLQNNPTTHLAVLTHADIALSNYGTAHPEFSWLGARKVTITERHDDSPYHILLVAEYGVVSANELLSPLSRSPEWSFESQPAQVAALTYWDGATRRPLTNAAGDYFEGLMADEQMVRARIKKNLANFAAVTPLIAATNKINSDQYLGCAVNTWKCAGVNTEFTTEVYNNTTHSYWATTIELQFRQSGWNLYLPNVGWNYIDAGQKRRSMVFDFENGEWVASANPVGLTLQGGLNLTGTPVILERRINEEASFVSLFGSPQN